MTRSRLNLEINSRNGHYEVHDNYIDKSVATGEGGTREAVSAAMDYCDNSYNYYGEIIDYGNYTITHEHEEKT